MSGFERALGALESAGITYRLRKPPVGDDELDLWMAPEDVAVAADALRPASLFPFHAPGQGSHRFFLGFDLEDARWRKLDVKIDGADRSKVSSGVSRRLPASARRLGPVIAVLGPDGAGKGTMIRGLKELLPVAVTEVYLGRRPRKARQGSTQEDRPSLASKVLPQSALLFWKAMRDWRKLAPAYSHAWRGHIVLCDRHPIEVLAVRPERSKVAMRVERFIARHLIPWPDLILVLDAPPEALLRRKKEHPIEVLERWRRGYAEAFGPRGALTISTAGSREESLRRASAAVWDALVARRGW